MRRRARSSSRGDGRPRGGYSGAAALGDLAGRAEELMVETRSILVPIDFSDGARAAVDHAAALGQGLGARLTALHVIPRVTTYEPLPTFPVAAPFDPEAQERLRGDARRFVTPAGSQQPLAEIVLREGDPADEILAAAAAGVDLIVLGRHGRRGFEHWLLGSVTERVVRKSDRPVLVVPPLARPPAFARVLCALDLSESSAAILEYAGGIARLMRGELIVLHVADGFHWYEPGPIAGVDVEAVRRALEESAREHLARLITRCVPEGAPVDVRVRFGRAHHEIEQVAAQSADLVVVGASSGSAMHSFFFGSTAQHVLRSGVCPVLLFRPRASGTTA